MSFLAKPKNAEPKSQPRLDTETQEITSEQVQVIKDMTKAI